MTKPQWQIDVEQKQRELQDLLDATKAYVGKDPSVGLYDLYVKIGKKAEEISYLYQKNLPV
ncbi:hypothetical protein KPL74_01750 [Bacillus sp. NP157]|nr:hypothetical protein KPL74_01750 [Bacillus sp. NP157]